MERVLGQAGFSVSAIGFGTWGIGGDSYGITEDKTSVQALKTALEAGITFFDAADLYGTGRSERLLAQAIAGQRENVILATKGGYRLDNSGDQDFSPAYLRSALEASLKRLGTHWVDIYFLHSPPPTPAIIREALEELHQLKKEGLIRSVGVSLRSVEDGPLVLATGLCDVVQVIYNLVDQRPVDNNFFAACLQQNVGVVARVPLCFGLLTTKYKVGTQFGEMDQRARWGSEQIDRWIETAHEFDFLWKSNLRSPAQAALRFCLAHPAVSTAIPGMKYSSQVRENAATLDCQPLSIEEIAQIKKVYRENPCIPFSH